MTVTRAKITQSSRVGTEDARGVEEKLSGAQLGAELFFEHGDDARGDVVDLRVGEGGFAALQRDFYQQRVFAGGDIFAAEEVGGFDGRNFGNVERGDGASDIGKVRAVGKQ